LRFASQYSLRGGATDAGAFRQFRLRHPAFAPSGFQEGGEERQRLAGLQRE
jgi:hypothetical protein